VSEIYGGSHDSGGDDAGRRGSSYPSFGSSWGGPWRPDYRDAPGRGTGDDDYDSGGYLDPAEQEHGMTRGEYADYLRSLPTDADAADREGTRVTTWDDRSLFTDDTDPDAANYADLDVLLAGRDYSPPPPEELQATTCGDHPVVHDETDLDADHNDTDHGVADESALDQSRSWALTPQDTDGAASGEQLYPDSGNLDQPEATVGHEATDADAADRGEADDAWRQRITELEAANADLRAENSQLGKGFAEMEITNAKLWKNVVALEARIERVEKSRQDMPTSEVAARRQPAGEREEGRDDQERRRRGPSDEAFVFGATAAGGILTTVADFVSRLPAADAGIAASFLATGAAGVAWIHKRREAAHADRSEGREANPRYARPRDPR
jgi:hypothetical protein